MFHSFSLLHFSHLIFSFKYQFLSFWEIRGELVNPFLEEFATSKTWWLKKYQIDWIANRRKKFWTNNHSWSRTVLFWYTVLYTSVYKVFWRLIWLDCSKPALTDSGRKKRIFNNRCKHESMANPYCLDFRNQRFLMFHKSAARRD